MKKRGIINRKEIMNSQAGFTIIELIIIIAIMAILTGIIATNAIGYIKKAKEAKILQQADAFSNAAVAALADFKVHHLMPDELGDWNNGTGNFYTAITNTKAAPKGGREWYLYENLGADSVSRDFEGIVLYNYKTEKVVMMRYKDVDANVVYEWTETTTSWQKLDSYPADEQWAQIFLRNTGTASIMYNGT